MKKSIVIGALGALAQETRLDIFRLLVQKGPQGLPAGEIGSRRRSRIVSGSAAPASGASVRRTTIAQVLPPATVELQVE